MSTDKLLTLTQAANEIGCSYFTLAHWIHDGKIKGIYTGLQQKRARYVSQSEVKRAKRIFAKGGAR